MRPQILKGEDKMAQAEHDLKETIRIKKIMREIEKEHEAEELEQLEKIESLKKKNNTFNFWF